VKHLRYCIWALEVLYLGASAAVCGAVWILVARCLCVCVYVHVCVCVCVCVCARARARAHAYTQTHKTLLNTLNDFKKIYLLNTLNGLKKFKKIYYIYDVR